MPRKRQIKYLYWQRLADGTDAAYWKPSPQLRAAGWANRKVGQRDALGNGELEAIQAALDLNRQLAEWRAGTAGRAAPPPPPRKLTFADLVAEYRASEEWATLAPATQAEYNVRLRQLTEWALDGALHVRQLDGRMIDDLRKALRGGSVHVAASTLRVLRILVNFALDKHVIDQAPVKKWKIQQPPSRARVLDRVEDVEPAIAAAHELGWPSVALALRIGLWSLQRQSDVLACSRLTWRSVDDCTPADRAVLTGPGGEVMVLWLRQQKTGAWVACPIPPAYHEEVDAAFAANAGTGGQPLLVDDDDARRPRLTAHLLQRRVRKCFARAGVRDATFRDLRRAGMSMLGSLGVRIENITKISGHAVLGRKTIVDTYMPPDVEGACSGMATALRTLQAREAREAAR